MTESVLCFGGPLNEQFVSTVDHGTYFKTAASQGDRVELLVRTSVPVREVAYRLRKVGGRLGPDEIVMGFYVVEGYPAQRILDQVEAVLMLCRLTAGWRLPS